MKRTSVSIADTTPELQALPDLLAQYGELVGGKALQRCLGFTSSRSFQRAHQFGHLPVTTFSLAGRRGLFARTRDIAIWLASLGRPMTPDGTS